jgi:CRISPR-associated protein Csm4
MVTTFHIAALRFTSGFHLGIGEGEEYDRSATQLHSDTLAAALCSIRATLGDTDLRSFSKSFRVSSSMPRYQGRLFLPLPPDKRMLHVRGNDPMLKQLKKLQWIERPLWEQLAREGSLEVTDSMISRCGTALACTNADTMVLQHRMLEPKVSVGHHDGDATPYYFDRLFLDPNVELCILYCTDDEARFRATMTLLGETGIGTSKTSGNGQFIPTFTEVDIDTPQADASQLLSLWIPSTEELQRGIDTRSCYQMLLRGGYLAGASDPSLRHLTKRRVWSIDAGSIIVGSTPQGTLIDLRPEGFPHPAWRSGRPLSLPFNYRHHGV